MQELAKNVALYDLSMHSDMADARQLLAVSALSDFLFRSLIDPDRGKYRVATVIVESDYIDRDFNAAYTRFYARAFRDSHRAVKRAHFFFSHIDEKDLRCDEAGDSYLGFFTLYPGPTPRVGRSVLAPVSTSEDQTFMPCQGRFTVNLLGSRLVVSGTPFIEQDGRVAACASAAIWIASRTIPRVAAEGDLLFDDENLRAAALAEITDLATKYTLGAVGDPLLSPGLNIEQILLGLRELGYLPVVLRPNDSAEARRTVYHYVESQIPVILAISLPKKASRHAITVVGHTYNPRQSIPNPQPKSMGASEWCPKFVFSDDQHGPYLEFEFGDATAATGGRPAVRVVLDDIFEQSFKGSLDFFDDAGLLYVIAPIPPRVFLLADDAEDIGRILLEEAFIEHNVVPPVLPVYRTYLTRSNAIKRRFVAGLKQGFEPEVVDFYRTTSMSRYVWVVEMCDAEDRLGVAGDELKVTAEAILDATAGTDVVDFITMRIPGHLMRLEDGGSVEDAIVNSTPTHVTSGRALRRESIWAGTAKKVRRDPHEGSRKLIRLRDRLRDIWRSVSSRVPL